MKRMGPPRHASLLLVLGWACSSPGYVKLEPEPAQRPGEGGAAEASEGGAGGAEDVECTLEVLPFRGTIKLPRTRDFAVVSETEAVVGQTVDNRLELYELCSPTPAHIWQLPASPRHMAYDATTRTVFVGLSGSTHVAVVRLDSDEVQLIRTDAQVRGMTLVDTNTVAAWLDDHSSIPDTAISVLDGDALEVRTTVRGDFYEYLAYSAPLGHLLTVGNPGGATHFLAKNDFTEFAEIGWIGAGSNCSEVAVSADGQHAAIPCGGGNGDGYSVFDFDAATLRTTYGQFVTGAYPRGAAFSDDGRFFASSDTRDIVVFDAVVYSEYAREPSQEVLDVGFSPSASVVFGLGLARLQWFKL